MKVNIGFRQAWLFFRLVEHGNFTPRHPAVFIDGVADNLPVAHDDHALAIGGNVQFVRNHDDGDAGFIQLLKQAHDFDAGAGIEIAGRFVGEQHFRLADERSGNGDALLLSARKLAGKVIAPLAQPDFFQSLHGPIMPVAKRHQRMTVKQRQFDIFLRGRTRQQVETLKDKTEFLVSQFGQLFAVEIGHGDAIKEIGSGRGLVEAADGVHQRGLARTAGAHDGHELAAVDVQRDAAHGFHLNLAGLVGAGKFAQLNHRSTHVFIPALAAAGCQIRLSWQRSTWR